LSTFGYTCLPGVDRRIRLVCHAGSVTTCSTTSRAREARRAGAWPCRHAGAPLEASSWRRSAHARPGAGWPQPGLRRASGAGCLPLALPGHVGADAAVKPAAHRTGSRRNVQPWRAVLQSGPSLRRLILKPCGSPSRARLRRVASRALRASGRLLAGIHAAPIGGMAGSELCPRLGLGPSPSHRVWLSMLLPSECVRPECSAPNTAGRRSSRYRINDHWKPPPQALIMSMPLSAVAMSCSNHPAQSRSPLIQAAVEAHVTHLPGRLRNPVQPGICDLAGDPAGNEP
jgi:hypothetical protein